MSLHVCNIIIWTCCQPWHGGPLLAHHPHHIMVAFTPNHRFQLCYGRVRLSYFSETISFGLNDIPECKSIGLWSYKESTVIGNLVQKYHLLMELYSRMWEHRGASNTRERICVGYGRERKHENEHVYSISSILWVKKFNKTCFISCWAKNIQHRGVQFGATICW